MQFGPGSLDTSDSLGAVCPFRCSKIHVFGRIIKDQVTAMSMGASAKVSETFGPLKRKRPSAEDILEEKSSPGKYRKLEHDPQNSKTSSFYFLSTHYKSFAENHDNPVTVD